MCGSEIGPGRCPGLLGTLGRAAEPVVQKQLLNSMLKSDPEA